LKCSWANRCAACTRAGTCLPQARRGHVMRSVRAGLRRERHSSAVARAMRGPVRPSAHRHGRRLCLPEDQ
jgi:hypothetical protein